MGDPDLFDNPQRDPDYFRTQSKVIFKRLFRVYAHIYHSHFTQFVTLAAEAHLNTCFKRFVFFILEFDLVSKNELAPLQQLITSLQSDFSNGGEGDDGA